MPPISPERKREKVQSNGCVRLWVRVVEMGGAGLQTGGPSEADFDLLRLLDLRPAALQASPASLP